MQELKLFHVYVDASIRDKDHKSAICYYIQELNKLEVKLIDSVLNSDQAEMAAVRLFLNSKIYKKIQCDIVILCDNSAVVDSVKKRSLRNRDVSDIINNDDIELKHVNRKDNLAHSVIEYCLKEHKSRFAEEYKTEIIKPFVKPEYYQ